MVAAGMRGVVHGRRACHVGRLRLSPPTLREVLIFQKNYGRIMLVFAIILQV
jgi:hypothetical protein